jgi:hypothetical protein
MGPSEIRASWLKYTMRGVRRQPADIAARVSKATGESLVRSIREAPAMGWMPGEHFVTVCTALRETLGADGARAFWNESLHDAIDQSLIRPLAMGGLKIFGRTPSALCRRTPQAWALVTRHFGEMHAAPPDDPRRCVVRVEGLPAHARTHALLHMWEGGFMGQARFVDERATVATDAHELAAGRACFVVRW